MSGNAPEESSRHVESGDVARDPDRGARERIGAYLGQIVRSRAVVFWGFLVPAALYVVAVTVFVDATQYASTDLPAIRSLFAVGYGVLGASIVSLFAFGQRLLLDARSGRRTPHERLFDLVCLGVATVVVALASFGFVLLVAVPTEVSYTLFPSAVGVALAAVALASVAWMVVALALAAAAAAIDRPPEYAGLAFLALGAASFFLTGSNGVRPREFSGSPELLNLLPNAVATRLSAVELTPVERWIDLGFAPPRPPSVGGGLAVLAAVALAALAVAGVARRLVTAWAGEG